MTDKKRVHFLIPFGCLLVVFALLNLYRADSILQYAMVPDLTWSDVIEQMQTVRTELADAVSPLTIHATQSGCPLSSEYDTSESDVLLYQVGLCWNEVYPQKMTLGEPLSYSEIATGMQSIVLDSDLAFKLFGDRDPLGQLITLGDNKYTVVGVAKHSRGVGETADYAAWVPLGCDESLSADLLVISAHVIPGKGAETLFGDTVSTIFGQGTLYDISKEQMRSTMILRVIALVVIVRLLAMWLGVLKRWGLGWLAEYKTRIAQCYARQLIGFAALRIVAMLLMAAVTLAACWYLMQFFIQPVLVFTEWVPDVLVSFNSIKTRFWELCEAAASPVSCVTAEMAALRFYAALVRWGVIFALIGVMMTAYLNPKARSRKKERFTQK